MPFSDRLIRTSAVGALTAGLVATAVAPAAAGAPVAAAPVRAAETLVVGGTTFPSVSASTMASFTNTFSPVLVNVPYPAELAPFAGDISLGTSVAAGAATLVEMIETSLATTGSIVVWGISQGALVINAASQVLAANPDRHAPDALTLVRVADPATPLTGLLNFLPDAVLSLLEMRPGIGAAADTPFNTVIIVNSYDAFSDWPSNPNPVAVLNALFGLVYRHGQTAFADLQSVPAENISVTINSYGATTTTYRVPSPDLPLTRPLREAGVPTSWVDALDQWLQPMIDAGYATPAAPLPAPAAVPARATTRVIAAGVAGTALVRPAESTSPAGGYPHRAAAAPTGPGEQKGLRLVTASDAATRPKRGPGHRRQ